MCVVLQRQQKGGAMEKTMDKETVKNKLQLKPHTNGGYFIPTYTSPEKITKDAGSQQRPLWTCIYYMLTDDSPINYFNKNRSDIVHFYHQGSPVRYHVLTPEGKISSTVLGSNITAGQKPQFMVRAGCWKASELLYSGPNFNLISEGVAPGYDCADRSIATKKDIQKLIPKDWERYTRFIKT